MWMAQCVALHQRTQFPHLRTSDLLKFSPITHKKSALQAQVTAPACKMCFFLETFRLPDIYLCKGTNSAFYVDTRRTATNIRAGIIFPEGLPKDQLCNSNSNNSTEPHIMNAWNSSLGTEVHLNFTLSITL